MPVNLPSEEVPVKELIKLCAPGLSLYSRTFFNKTVHQDSPAFHEEIASAVENPDNRFVSIEVFRGGAKTTLLRLLTSKRIAYGISRLILYVSETQDHSKRSLRWIKRQVEYNRKWEMTYGLSRGEKWSDEEIQIVHKAAGITISVVAVGITGQTRGLNIDDARPDLIVVDDPCDEENTATDIARTKTASLFFGSLMQSLTPKSECLDATMVLLQTPLARGDLITSCRENSQFTHIQYSCFDEKGESRWKSRWTTAELKTEREQYVNSGQLPTWLREKECKLVSGELSQFPEEALQYWDVLPEGLVVVISIDPVPPPSERELTMGLRDKDYEAITAVGASGDKFYLCEYALNRGHDPDWTVAKLFEMIYRWNPILLVVESVAYQRTLKWLIEKAMRARQKWVPCTDTKIARASLEDGRMMRKKIYRISDGIGYAVSRRSLYVHPSHAEFIEQYLSYPDVSHDDLIETVANAIPELVARGSFYEGEFSVLDESKIPELEFGGGCP